MTPHGGNQTRAPEVEPRRRATELGTVLGVWAHPDDECYLSAGLMAMATDGDVRVVCVTATKGEAGTPDPDEWPPERLAPVREAEMAASLEILGVDEHHWLGHCDGSVHEVDDEVGIAQVAEVIAEVRPDTVVTFGPDGMTGHGDHITVGRWATTAARAADHRPRVLHAAVDGDLFDAIAHHFDELPVYGPEGPPLAHRERAALTLELPDEILDRKVAALRAQASQTAGLIEMMTEPVYRRWCSVEAFVEAAPEA